MTSRSHHPADSDSANSGPSVPSSAREEFFRLLTLQAEDRLTDADMPDLNRLLRSHPQLITTWVDYMQLHAQLTWDAGMTPALSGTQTADLRIPGMVDVAAPIGSDSGSVRLSRRSSRPERSRVRAAALVTAAAGIIGLIAFGIAKYGAKDPAGMHLAGGVPASDTRTVAAGGAEETVVPPGDRSASEQLTPLRLNNLASADGTDDSGQPTETAGISVAAAAGALPVGFSDEDVISEIDRLLQDSWTENEVTPSPAAGAWEWSRRVYLTTVGRIPTPQESVELAVEDTQERRLELLGRLTSTDEHHALMAMMWSNLLVGRRTGPDVDRQELTAWLHDQFRQKRAWIDTVEDLITADDRSQETGASNFLVAHLNNEATPATAVTARLFLGVQLQCVQCHDHPFSKELTQKDYWALNAFFKGTERRRKQSSAGAESTVTGADWILTSRPASGATFFETLSGRQVATLPEFDGQALTSDALDRRRELARMLRSDSERRVARAMVNRMWSHFFGYGFTSAVDDIGPHAQISHPELLALLTNAFEQSGYDLHRLTVWIGGSTAWQRSAAATEGNASDDPDSGVPPLFTRVYPRRMSPEQMYESVRVAVNAVAGNSVQQTSMWSQHRDDWVAQFVRVFDTDENDEVSQFEGTISQALVMMNSPEISDAIRDASEMLVRGNERMTPAADDALARIAMATVVRPPTDSERDLFRGRLRSLRRSSPGGTALSGAAEDMMWAYLNSSEFALLH